MKLTGHHQSYATSASIRLIRLQPQAILSLMIPRCPRSIIRILQPIGLTITETHVPSTTVNKTLNSHEKRIKVSYFASKQPKIVRYFNKRFNLTAPKAIIGNYIGFKFREKQFPIIAHDVQAVSVNN
jgi:hypothetical protein